MRHRPLENISKLLRQSTGFIQGNPKLLDSGSSHSIQIIADGESPGILDWEKSKGKILNYSKITFQNLTPLTLDSLIL